PAESVSHFAGGIAHGHHPVSLCRDHRSERQRRSPLVKIQRLRPLLLGLFGWCFVGRGTILDPRELRDEGLHVIWPWDKLYIYTLRLPSSTQTYNAITKDGVNVTAQINVRFQLLHNYVAVLHKFIGPQ